MRILFVEDEQAIAEPLIYLLQAEGWTVEHCLAARPALLAHQTRAFDLLILDVGLPDLSGWALLRQIRALPLQAEVPVIFLTARNDEVDRIMGLELGADDYITKPFSPREVCARVRAIFRREQRAVQRQALTAATAAAVPATWQHQPEQMSIAFKGQRLLLTRYEYRLLALLITQPGRVMSREHIMQAVWFDAPETADRTIDAHIKTLRAKLRAIADDEVIQTWRGVGYSVQAPGA